MVLESLTSIGSMLWVVFYPDLIDGRRLERL
jgi:hypothetical protein